MKYTPVDAVNVFLDEHKVGRLALVDRRIYFEYDADFLTTGIEISPYKLPLKAGATSCDDQVFEGLFGVFNDSLPDGWGRLLLDRQVQSHGIAPQLLTPLDRLTHVGAHGMGALRYEPDVTTTEHTENDLNLDHLAAESAQLLEGEAEEVFSELLSLAGSSAGARPKVMVGVSNDYKYIIHGQQELPTSYEHWLIKFPSGSDAQDIGAIEYAYSLMAQAAEIPMPTTHLFPAQKGSGYFGVKRFDRIGNEPIHMHSLCGYLHADHRLPSLDYLAALKATWVITKNMQEVKKMFRLAVFNVLAHNRDDHSKNFSFLMSKDGEWKISPAYDLTFSNGPAGEQSMTVMGEGKNPTTAHLLKLAEALDIKDAVHTIEMVQTAISNWPVYAKEAGVSTASTKRIAKVIASRIRH